MKKIAIALAAIAAFTAAHADVYVRGHYRSNGAYVEPYHRTTPNGTQRDNYGSTGVYNPNTGHYGTDTPSH